MYDMKRALIYGMVWYTGFCEDFYQSVHIVLQLKFVLLQKSIMGAELKISYFLEVRFNVLVYGVASTVLPDLESHKFIMNI